jgi:hypothetical protein
MCADVGRGRQVDRYWHTLLVGEEVGLLLVHLVKAGPHHGVLASESLELVHGPSSEVLVDVP